MIRPPLSRAHALQEAEGEIQATEKMRLVVAAVALAAGLLGSGWCQRDCAYPVDSDIRSVIVSNIRASDSPTEPTITLTSNFQLVCLAHSQLKGRYRVISFLVQYTCDGNSECPGGTVEEQFESQCVGNGWSYEVLGSVGNTRTTSLIATNATVLREDCAFCATRESALGAGSPVTPDNATHCIACQNCNSEEEGEANRCFGFGADQCCNVYLPNGMCDTACPENVNDVGTGNDTTSVRVQDLMPVLFAAVQVPSLGGGCANTTQALSTIDSKIRQILEDVARNLTSYYSD